MIDAPGWEWKQRALEDFRKWLETLPEAAGFSAAWDDPDGGLMAGCDLHGVFAELSALRQEVRGQNREQSKAVRELSQASGLCGRLAEEARQREKDAAAMARERKEDLAGVERRARSAAEAECIRSFVEVRDALARGSDAASRVGGMRLRFLPGGRRLTAIAEGYVLALRRFDRVLAGTGRRVGSNRRAPVRFPDHACVAVGPCRRDGRWRGCGGIPGRFHAARRGAAHRGSRGKSKCERRLTG